MKKVGGLTPVAIHSGDASGTSKAPVSNELEVRRQKSSNSLFVQFSSNFKHPTSNSIGCCKLLVAGFLLTTQYATPVYACAVCFGNKDSLQTKGTMAGVLFLLIVIVVVLAGFAVTFVRWGLRERALQESLGPASSEPGHS